MTQATTVAAQGTAETDYDLAHFSVALTAENKTAPSAKADLKKQVDALIAALDAMKAKLSLEFVKNSVNTHTSVQEKWVYNPKKSENEFAGFTAHYRYNFQISELNLVSEVYDVLSSLEEATTASPSFSIKQSTRDKVNKKALKAAFKKVQDRIETECGVLGLNVADFEIASWEATYSDSQRSDRVAAATRKSAGARVMSAMTYSADVDLESVGSSRGEGSEPLEIVVGKAQVTANLEVGYAKLPPQTAVLKATVVKQSPRSEETTNV